MEAKIWNSSGWVDRTEPLALKAKYDERLRSAGFTVLGFLEYHFNPYGFTALWLLAESHFALHTFPEENKSYWELSSCSAEKFNRFTDGNATN